MKISSNVVFVFVASALAAVGFWFAVFHASGQPKVGMLISVALMVASIILSLFVSKKEREGKKLVSTVFRRGVRIPAVIIGAVIGALFWWLAFRVFQH
jgi:uncharacterized membrane protein